MDGKKDGRTAGQRDVEAGERGNGRRRKSRNKRNLSVEVMFCLEAL